MKLVIIGGVAGGAAAAARARRLSEDADIVVFERGKYISFANCGLPYHIGGEIKDREKLLVATPELFRDRFNVEIRLESELTAINRDKHTVTVNGPDGKEYEESYDKLLISTGAEPVRPPVPGVDSEKVMTLRTIPDMDKIIETITKNKAKRAIVVGGGFIGLEMVENLSRRGIEVALVELLDQVMPPFDPEMAALLHSELENNNIALWLGDGARSFEETGDGITVTLKSGRSIMVDFIVLAAGVKPEGMLAESAGLRMGMRGSISTDNKMQTSDTDIYAVGDAVQVERFPDGASTLIPLAGPAGKEARVAVNNIFGIPDTYRGTQGTSVCRVFGLTAASTGLNEKTLKALAIPYDKVFVHPANHVGYYPGSYQMTLKVLWRKDDGVVMGAQCIGHAGVDKRIDVLATAIQANMTMRDISEVELCYAPPFGSPKDPVNFAGMVAVNAFDDVMPLKHWDMLEHMNPEEYIVLDVRDDDERSEGHVPGSAHLPVDEIRERIEELEQYRGREILVHCMVGIRSYIAGRILKQNGFNVSNLSGGYKTFCQYHPTTCRKELSRNDELKESFCTTPRG